MGLGLSAFRLPPLARVAPDIAAFALGAGIAGIFGWTTTDFVWSLWLSSLVVGSLTILSTIGQGLYLGAAVVGNPQFPARYRVPSLLAGCGVGLFLLLFFCFHFCGFHAGHAAFLTSFFPLEGLPRDAFGRAFMNPPLLWATAVHYVAPLYGAFLIPVVIAERRGLFGPLHPGLLALLSREAQPVAAAQPDPARTARAATGAAHNLFARPYINVVRMHVLILFFGFCHTFKIESSLSYVAVYALYFFPLSAFRPPVARA